MPSSETPDLRRDAPPPEPDDRPYLASDEVVERLARGEAADDDELRGLLAEVAGDLAAVAESASASVSDAGLPGLNPHVRAAILDRFSAPEQPEQPGQPEQPLRLTPASPAVRVGERPRLRSRMGSGRRWPMPLRAAALVLLTLGAFLLTSPPQEANASLRLTGIDRLSLDEGTPHLGNARRLALGARVAPGPAERVALRFPGEGALLLDGRAEVEVVRMPGDLAHLGFRLDAGRARIRSATRPVEVAFRDRGTLVVRTGEACARVEQDPGIETPAVWLPAGCEATWVLADGRAVALLGPLHAALEADGVRTIEDAVAPCRELAFFGPARTARADGRQVDSRRWRVVQGGSRRRGTRLELDLPARLAWRPAGGVAEARALRIVLRSVGDVRVVAPALGVDAVTPPAPLSGAVGRRVVIIPLPPKWFERLGEGELELEFVRPETPRPHAPGAVEDITFEGATFLEDFDDER